VDSPIACIGPNALIQTFAALEELEGSAAAARVRGACELPSRDLDSMVPEAWFVRLLDALHREVPEPRAQAVLARSGALTARYVATHRIPRSARLVLRWLPPRLAVPLLLKAFEAHAWTFAGDGELGVEGPYPHTLTLRHAPTCRGSARRLGRRGAYYRAAFEGLLQLAAPGARVRETSCESEGADRCRFAIEIHPARRT